MKTFRNLLMIVLGTGGAMRGLFAVTAGFVLSLALAATSFAADPNPKALPGHVPAAVHNLSAKGRPAAGSELHLAIGLPLRDSEGLETLLQQVYDPASPNYHHYLTPQEFTARFGPTEADYQAVADFAQANGLKVVATHPNRVVLDVRGKVVDIEKAFHVNLRTYQHPNEGREFFAPDTEPIVAGGLSILRVDGLDNYSIPHPHYKAKPLNQNAVAAPAAGSGPGGSYQGNDFRKAYVPGTTLTGAGQNVGLLQFDGFFQSDITAYENQIGLTGTVPNVVVIPVDGGVPSPNPFSGGVGEVSLDIEMVLSMSPGVSNIYVYEAPNPSPWVDLLSKMANDNLAKQLSCSWGGGGPDPVAEQLFQQMAVQGQTFVSASGDFNAFNNSDNPIEFPSDSTHITQVGGTTLTTTGGGNYTSETVWNWGFNPSSGHYIGSSGGISTTYAIPSWQTNINFTLSKGSSTMRNIPDVALTGDNCYVIYGSGQTGAFGGTSCAAPLWAGFLALVNQQATNNGHAPVGFMNPALYTIAKGTNYNNCFHDVTTGNNTNSGSANLFFAVNNYDLCTGLGTPRGTNLINILTAVNVTNPVVHLTPPSPPYGTTMASLIGANPNGTWELFVMDDQMFDAGTMGGWTLTLISANVIGTAADDAVAVTASPTTISAGSGAYYITVTNYGPSISTNIVVSDIMPVNSTLVSTNVTQGTVAHSGALLTWTIGTLATNAGAKLTIVVQPTASGSMVNTATVNAGTADPNADDDTASATITVNPAVPPSVAGLLVGTNGLVQFSITSGPGQTNVIQASTNLVNWVPVYTNVGNFIFTDVYSTNYPVRFYRDIVVGP